MQSQNAAPIQKERKATAENVAEAITGLVARGALASGNSSPDQAGACLAGLWLMAGNLEASHSTSQTIHTPEGSYWHALMHRREGDFSNSDYWFRRTGHHRVFDRLAHWAQTHSGPGALGGSAAPDRPFPLKLEN